MLLVKPKTKVRCAKHYWLIEEADGEFSKAWCKHCGASAVFRNVLQDFHSWVECKEYYYVGAALNDQHNFEESRNDNT